ncbi:A disintegrin and metalloproteinase with thrombospondin motifs 1-like [Oculina patagonica]
MSLPPSVMCILLYLSSLIHNGENRVINGKPLHHLMTKEEMKQFFGEEHLSSVPEYDVALPFEANEEGNFVTYSLNRKSKRSLAEDENDNATPYRYIINVLGEKLDLRVKRNTKFMAPGLQLETRDTEGRRITKPVSRKSFVTGKVASDPYSMVALSVTDGLHGIVKRSRDTLLIHPLPTRLARHFESKEGATPHLVYRRSPQEGMQCHTIPGKISAKRDVSSLESTNQLQADGNDIGITHKYLEVALLADEQLVANHGNKTEEFLLLIGSITDRIFQDATIGSVKINYVITRLVLVTNEELGVDPANSSISHGTVIQKVAAWARNNNRDNESDPLQFDVAVLIRSGKTGALAVFGGICHSDDIVSVVGENGLQTAYTIAHETAHNLGVGHDSEGNNCNNSVNLMSSVLQGGPGSVEWSTCSKAKIQNFLMGIDSLCLDDAPSTTRPKPPASFYTKLPGELADADMQCQHQYGPEYRRCPQKESDCGSLYCTSDGYTCLSRISRPLDGTACGLRSWCIKGYCVDNGSPMINGGWSVWSDFTACTRSCEGGVRYRERTCTNPPPENGGENCAGPSKAYWEICNSQVMCDLSEPSFRDQQCKQINSNYTAYYPPNKNPCKLACRLGGQYQFYGYVIDGTRCTSDRYVYDVCIQGQCQAVGCDHMLNSGKLKDRCGVCNGNGDSCTFVQSSYTEDYTVDWGHDTIVVLPANTSNAVFQQRNVIQYNIIGVQDENGKYLIPMPTWSSKVIYNAGTKISYSNDYESPDHLEIDGPTNMTLKIVYVHLPGQQNVGVDYHYYRQLASNEPPEPSNCHWITSSWSDCSTGQQTREVRCVRSDDLSPASADCCGENFKPNATSLCFGWHASGWQSCTKTCGKGSQSRSVVCRAKINDTHYQIESDSVCDSTPKPEELRYCNEIKCPAYRTSHLSRCSTVCLPGERTNYTTCSRTNKLGETEEVSDIQCGHEPKPPSITEPCNDDNPCKEHVIGCFKTPEGLFSETLGDFTQEPDPDQALMQCGELAHDQGYQVFALGFGGLCLSGPDSQDKYYLHKSPSKKNKDKCSNGIGIGLHSVVYSFEPLPEFEPVGCFKDKMDDRALSDNYANFRAFIDWYNMEATVRQCALVARDKGYEYFSVQFYGECWSSLDAESNYDRHGVQTDPDKCWENVGASSTNFVYRFRQVLA